MVKKSVAGACALALAVIIGYFLNKGFMFGVVIGAVIVWLTKDD